MIIRSDSLAELPCTCTGHGFLSTDTVLSLRLMRRAWQTLWKPVPELISILGVDVPDAPDVMLAGIGVDKATVNWARPQPNKPVQKFLIQVNGVVGKGPPWSKCAHVSPKTLILCLKWASLRRTKKQPSPLPD